MKSTLCLYGNNTALFVYWSTEEKDLRETLFQKYKGTNKESKPTKA